MKVLKKTIAQTTHLESFSDSLKILKTILLQCVTSAVYGRSVVDCMHSHVCVLLHVL